MKGKQVRKPKARGVQSKIGLSPDEVMQMIEALSDLEPEPDTVAAPTHYTQYPVEVIQLTAHMNFCRGNAVKYLARAGSKSAETEIEDLRKARQYIDFEIARLEGTL